MADQTCPGRVAIGCLLILVAVVPAAAQQSVAPAGGRGDTAQGAVPPTVTAAVQVFGEAEPAKTTVSHDPRTLPANVSVLQSVEIPRRSYREPGELLRSLPGVDFAYYGQGGIPSGPAVRGYTNRNFGQDIAGHLDGIPLNTFGFVASHGALDLTTIPLESLERIELVRGPIQARYGDFNRGATVNFVTADRISRPSVSVGVGSFGTLRFSGIYGNGDRGPDRVTFYSIVDGLTTDGYADNQDQQHLRTFHKLRIPFGRNDLAIAALTFSTEWEAPSYIDIEAVRSGAISEKRAVNPTDGGNQQMQLVYAQFRQNGGTPDEFAVTGYVGHTDWRRFRSDFLISPARTQVRQIDQRVKLGYRVEKGFGGSLFGRPALLTAGSTLHRDDADTQQANTLRREVLAITDDVPEVLTNFALYAEQQVQVIDRLKLTGGLRYSHVNYDIDDRLRAPDAFVSSYSASQVSPKGGIAFAPLRDVELYANVATGMRSPTPRTEVRNSVGSIDRVEIAETTSYEGGARVLLFNRVDLRGAIWRANNENEIRGIPPGGQQFESLGKSRRNGQEAEIRWFVAPTTRVFSSFSWVDARLLTPANPAAFHLPDVPGYVHQIGIDSGIPLPGRPDDTLVVAADLSFYGERHLNTLGTRRSESYERLSFRAVYQPRPQYRLWVGGFAFPGSVLGESAYQFGSNVGVRPNPRVSIDAGVSYTF